MDFGRRMLEKYGYKDGEGLGKNSTGITAPIKVLFKFDQTGLGGKNEAVKNDNWWTNCYNDASSNLIINGCGEANNIQIGIHDEEGVEITNKSYSMKKLLASGNKLQYGNFLKSGKLLADKEEEVEGHVSTADIEIQNIQAVDYNKLFEACDGRTAHKGARHGLKMNGKLQRIADQEKALLERMKVSKENVFKEPARAKKRAHVQLNTSRDESSDDEKLPLNLDKTNGVKKHKKGLKKKLRKISSKLTEFGITNSPEKKEEEAPLEVVPQKAKKRKMQCSVDGSIFKLKYVETNETEDVKMDQTAELRAIKRARKKHTKHDVPGIDKLAEGTRESFRQILGDDDVDMDAAPPKAKKVKKYKASRDPYEATGDDDDDDDEATDIVSKLNKEHHKNRQNVALMPQCVQEMQSFESSSKKEKKSSEKKVKEKAKSMKKSKKKSKKEKFDTERWEESHKAKVQDIEKSKRKKLKNMWRREEHDALKLMKKMTKQGMAVKAEMLAGGLENMEFN